MAIKELKKIKVAGIGELTNELMIESYQYIKIILLDSWRCVFNMDTPHKYDNKTKVKYQQNQAKVTTTCRNHIELLH